MSNNLVSQHLLLPGNQMGQLETISNKVDSTIRMGPMGHATNDMAQMMSISNMQMRLSAPMSNFNGSPKLPISNLPMGQIGLMENNVESEQFLMPNKQLEETQTTLNNTVPQKLSISNKRTAPVEPMSSNPDTQRLSMSNKRIAQMEHRPWLQQIYAPNAPHSQYVQMQSISSTPGLQHFPAPSKRVVQMESMPSKSGPKQVKNRGQLQPAPKVQTESFESVRSKMKESLAAALALVSQQQDKPSAVEKKSQSEVENTLQSQGNSQPAGSASATAATFDHISEESKEILPSSEYCSSQKHSNGQTASQEILTNKNTGNSTQNLKCNEQDFQSINILPDEDVSISNNFYVKDELLQGNGLSWVLDPGMVGAEHDEIQTDAKQKLDNEELGSDREDQAVKSPQILASKIEAELFKLYGGVNKKYKEKGRSLLFNLKDRNNPELRERVSSGEILPEQLCSMTAEELASKELSEWRIAKAEELAQMVVLPDSEVDVRRLVKKTHKGEFQVEFEHDDNVSVEVSVGATLLTQIPLKTKEKIEASPRSKLDKAKGEVRSTAKESNLDHDVNCTLAIPSNDGTDLMQGLMVDDALKDTEFLPPIVSLDEFMESLDTEPPFENLPVDAGKMTPISEKEGLEVGSRSKSSDQTPKDIVNTSPDKPEKTIETCSKSDTQCKSNEKLDTDMKSSDSSHVKSDITPSISTSSDEHVWEGLLQLNITATASVIGFFKSGEKTSAKEWPSLIEIKGRVRLEAFEKFLRGLRMSRSRGIMVVHFVWKTESPKSGQASLREVSDSYVMDERVGIAEPTPGLEIYFCPPHNTTLDLLSNILPTDHILELNAVDNGLIGVIIWRKPHLTSTTISPNSSSSHHKHTSKKHHLTSKKHQENVSNMNPNWTAKPVLPTTNLKPSPDDDNDDDDDVPPGFGPTSAQDEDDLPEYNFSIPQLATKNNPGGPRMTPFNPLSQISSRPVDQMRELIYKYGQTSDKRGTGVPIKSWKDDDDIPEWQPEAPQQQMPLHSFQQQQLLRPHMIINQQQPSQMQGSQNAWRAPPGHGHPNVGQFYGHPSRGF